jgi:hypothetical protein
MHRVPEAIHCETLEAAMDHAKAISARIDGGAAVYGYGYGYLASSSFYNRQPYAVFRSGRKVVPGEVL